MVEHPTNFSSIPAIELETADTVKKRLLSTLFLIPVAVIPTLLGGWWFNFLVMIAALLMIREWHGITNGKPSRGLFASEVITVLVSLALMAINQWPFSIGVLCVGAVLAHVIGAAAHRPLPWPGLGVLYVGLPVLALIWMRQNHDGLYWIAWIFLVVWSTDSLAYAFGRTIGGPKLVPRFSPGKTWAGLVGGMIGGAMASVGIGQMAAPEITFFTFAFLGALGAVVSQAGDIAESMLKRNFNVKDSGRLIPGHGGILDRVDGMVTTAVLLWGIILILELSGGLVR